MKCWILFITISLINLCRYSSVVGNIRCPPENCVTPDQCESVNNGQACEPPKVCCSVVKEEFRSHCRHHGGECASQFCNPSLIRPAVDCNNGTHCCVLV